ncbi:hypothetical protein WJX77_007649 [Trebouxia sp. C0004]
MMTVGPNGLGTTESAGDPGEPPECQDTNNQRFDALLRCLPVFVPKLLKSTSNPECYIFTRQVVAATSAQACHCCIPSPLGPDKLLCCVDLKLVAQERYEGWHPEKELFLDATAHGDAFLEKTKPLFAGKALRPALIDLEQQMCPSLQISLQKNQVHHQRKQCSGRQPI